MANLRKRKMSDKKRKCTVMYHGEKCKGSLIKFAPCRFSDNENVYYTAEQAIVELDNGDVIQADPAQITFMKPSIKA